MAYGCDPAIRWQTMRDLKCVAERSLSPSWETEMGRLGVDYHQEGKHES
jgi:hypothetical protein